MAKEIKNYLKSVKDITAPLNWKSSPDSPPTQLAYITQPEIDMLVKANIHGSMNGKPNKGPKGIMSLDGGGVEYTTQGPAGQDKPVSFGDQAGVTIDVSTQEGQDKRQKFRDDTGSNVVTDAEKRGREDLGRDPADTSAPPGGKSPTKGAGDGGGDDEEETKNQAVEFFKNAFEKLKGKDLTVPLTEEEMILYRILRDNEKNNRPNLNILEEFAQSIGAIANFAHPVTRYVGLAEGNKNLFRDDADDGAGGTTSGLNIAKLRELERAISGDKQVGPFYGELVDGGVSVNLPGSLTLAGRTEFIDDMLGSEFEERLKRQMPDVYYPDNPMPATSGGLANLGGKGALQKTADGKSYITPDGRTISLEAGANYNNMIFDARMQLDRMGKDMFGNKNMPTQTSGGGTYVPPTTTPDDPMIPQDPTLPPSVTPPTTTPKYPGSVVTNYTQLGLPQIYGNQQIPNYGNFYQGQGGQPIGLQDYLDNLRKKFGIE